MAANTTQSKSETTEAAQTLFNLPEQPQHPVTTGNISQTINKAVKDAFTEKEKKDVQKLKVHKVAKASEKSKEQSKENTPPSPIPVIDKPAKTPRKITTPTGASINKLADGLRDEKGRFSKQFSPNLKEKASKQVRDEKGRFITTPEEKTQLLSNVVGKNMAAKAIHTLAEKPKVEETAEPIANPHNDNIEILQKKVEQLEQDKKAEKVPDPVVVPTKPKDPIVQRYNNAKSRAEAAEALKALGFKKNEFNHLLDAVDHIEKTEDKILYVLKLKANPHAKIPAKEVPAAIEKAKIENKVSAESIKADPGPKKEEPKVEPKTTSKAEPVQPETPKVSPKPAETKDSNADQEKVEKDKEKAEEEKKAKAAAERQKKIEKQLEDIKNLIGNHGVFDLISKGISALLKGLIPILLGPVLKALPSILSVLGKASLVIGAGILAYEGASYLLKKMGYTGETLGKLFSGQDAAYQKQQDTYNKYENKDAILGRLNAKLKGTGYTALGAGQYKNAQGQTVKAADLPPSVQSKLNLKLTPTEVKKDVSKLESVPIDPKSDMAAQKLNPPDAEPEAPTQPPVVVQQDNSKTTVVQAPSNNDGGAIIKVRNDEPSASGLVSSLFDHPAGYLGIYRM